MATVLPKGETLRQAVKWISCELQEGKNRKIALLIQEAASRYNLSPKDEEFLCAFYEEEKG
ncbi:MAG: hypothetical protein JRJ06_01190 [Deltaproteobacteria bacterium]|nr:hypothetical protein [Deltaproteobacteria bacterium]